LISDNIMMVMTISLQPITSTNWVTCIELRPTPQQQEHGWVSPNVFSLAQAYAERWWIPTGVYRDQTMVGFILYGCWPPTPIAPDYGRREPGVYHVLRLMIDQRYQGQGYGYAAMHRLITQLRSLPEVRAVEVNYDADNLVVTRLFRRLGFEPTGEVDEGEIRARLVLSAAPP
jgi:diamine N-acetyltransferase